MRLISTIVQPAAWSGEASTVTQKAGIATSVLAEARRLAERGDFGALLNQLVSRASELLEDIDEILIALDPLRDERDFAAAAALHRELETIQAAIPTQRREGRALRRIMR
jgi:hypothetical protein